MDMKRFFLYAIVIAALALAGCGSDGKKVATMPPDPPAPPMVMCSDGSTAATQDECDRRAAAAAAATKAAGTKRMAIAAEADQETDAGLGGSNAPETTASQRAGEYNLNIKYGETSIVVEGDAADDNVTFMQAMDFGGGRTMHTRTMDADDDGNVVQEVVMVKTDIKAPTNTAFAMVSGQELNGRADGRPVDSENPADALIVKTANLSLVMSDEFNVSPGVDERTFDAKDGDTMAAEFAGTYNGASGKYKCVSSADCVVRYNTTDGKISSVVEGDWVFIPNAGATSPVVDSDYLAYGFWLKRTRDVGGAVTYNEVQAFTGGTVSQTDVGNIQNIVGPATYTGDSTGVYVKNVTDNQGAITSATSGHYSADVSMTANFGGGKLGVDNQFRIEGTVKNFTLSNGEANDWAVKLESADFSGRAADALDGPAGSTFANMFAGTTIGDSTSTVAKGSWNGGFYGEASLITEGENPRNAPAHVMGEFNANFTDGAVLGAFGATKGQ